MSLLERSGIIEVRGADSKTIKLCDDYNSKWQLTVGDGLSQMRMQQYNEAVDAASVNFRQYYRQSMVFSQAMNHVVMIPGNLHGRGFHFLAVVSLLFYGAFLQSIQYALGWKRLHGTDVTKTYQQCASLALMVLGEVERGLYGMFIADLVEEKGKEYFESYVDCLKELGTHLGTLFIDWLETKSRTTDEILRLCLFFLKTTQKYKLF